LTHRRQRAAATAPPAAALFCRNVVDLRETRRHFTRESAECFSSQRFLQKKHSAISRFETDPAQSAPPHSAAQLSAKTQLVRSADEPPLSETAPPIRARFDRNTQSDAVRATLARRTAPPASSRFLLWRKEQRETVKSDEVESTSDWRTKRRFDRARDSTTSGVDRNEWNADEWKAKCEADVVKSAGPKDRASNSP
jgi:hypothetical protein